MNHVWLRTCISLGMFVASSCLLSAGNLSVVTTNPEANAAATSVAASITVVFDRPVDINTVNPQTFMVFGRVSGMVEGTFSFGMANRQVTFTRKRQFSPGEFVDVILTHNIADTEGVTLRSAGYAWNFWVQTHPADLKFTKVGTLITGPGGRSYGGVGADLNGDGAPDLAIINEDSADLRVFLNEGKGNFGKMNVYPTRLGGSPTAVADFNGDGITDIASANWGDDSVSVLLGTGDGRFMPQSTYRVGELPFGIALLDANGDGFMDIVVCNYVTADLSILINNGDGTFAPEQRFFNVPDALFHGLAAADMNGDGIPDLVVGSETLEGIFVLLGQGDGTFVQSAFRSTMGKPWVVRTGDLNGDGYMDVAVANLGSSSMALLFGDGKGGLSEPSVYSVIAPATVSIGDLNGDGSLDLVTSSPEYFTVFVNDGTGQFTALLDLPANGRASCAILHDFSEDGTLDISAVDEGVDEVILWKNR